MRLEVGSWRLFRGNIHGTTNISGSTIFATLTLPTLITQFLRWASTVSIYLIGAFIGLMQFVDPADQKVDGTFVPIFRWLHEHRFVIVASVFSVDVLARGILWLARKLRRIDTNQLSALLDTLVYEVFRDRDVENHHYRATLFKARRFVRVGNWLGIVARSGTPTRGKPRFSP